MRRVQRAAQRRAHRDELVGRKAPPCRQLLFERRAIDELHPDADTVANAFRAVDRHDVRMANASKQPAFFDCGRLDPVAIPLGVSQQLQRDGAIEPRVVSAVDVTVCASSDEFRDLQWPPLERRFGSLAALVAADTVWWVRAIRATSRSSRIVARPSSVAEPDSTASQSHG